jgi:hypothetical protein
MSGICHQCDVNIATVCRSDLDSMFESSLQYEEIALTHWHCTVQHAVEKSKHCGDENATVNLNDHDSMLESRRQYEEIILTHWHGEVQHAVQKFQQYGDKIATVY